MKLFVALGFLMGMFSKVQSHGTEVRHCITQDNKLRIFIEHWHGALTNPATAGTMRLKINDEDPKNLSPTGVINNVPIIDDSNGGCTVGTQAKVADGHCNRNDNNWVYYDFVSDQICNGDALSVQLFAGNTVYLTEGCTSLYPLTIAMDQGCTRNPTPQPTPQLSATPTPAPTNEPTAHPSAKPTPAPTNEPTAQPSAHPSARPSSAPSFESVSHSVCQNYAVHARTTITFDGVLTNIRGGDVSVSPGTAITGTPLIKDGEVVGNSDDFAEAVLVAHDNAMKDTLSTLIDIEIGGKTFTPGTHRSGSAINFAYGTVVTLDGENQDNPTFIFQAPSTLVTAADTYFILKNGAKAENVLWVLGTAATLGANSIVEGSILAGTAITFGTKSELHGCALAQSAVTFESEGSIDVMHYEDSIAGDSPARHLRGQM